MIIYSSSNQTLISFHLDLVTVNVIFVDDFGVPFFDFETEVANKKGTAVEGSSFFALSHSN